MGELIHCTVDRGIATLVLDNPPVNVVTLALTDDLERRLRDLAEDPAVRVLVVTGAGSKAFCAGSDIQEFVQYMAPGVVIDKKMAKEIRVYDALDSFPKPTIAAINGFAMGGGAELALCCDIRVMDEGKKIGFPECKLGVFPGSGGTQRLPRIVGEGIAKELMYTGDPIGAQRAYEIGLINRIAPAGEALALAMELANTISQRAGIALECIKETVDYGLAAGICEGQQRVLKLTDRVFRSEDIQEGVKAFMEKRPPQFKHR
ncbi:MAG TPA: enoyl-CoA hydratase-related protein [Chloroflexota bacterium]|nr:enoyl-CoA hydratase-related protein [Chloroflexota bacterium]